MGQVQDAGADLVRRAVRRDVGQADDRRRDRRRDGQVEDDLRHAEDGHRVDQRVRRERRPGALVRPQVAGEAVRRPAGAPRQRRARAGRRPVVVPVDPGRRSGLVRLLSSRDEPALERQCARGEPPLAAHGGRMRIGGRRAPSPRQLGRERVRRGVVALEPDHRRLGVGAVVDPAQVVVQESDQLMEVVDVRSGWRVARPAVDPVADERPGRGGAQRLHPERRVHVAVHPAADRVDRDLDRVVVRSEGALPPVRPVGLVAQPLEQPRRGRLQAGAPLVQPALATERRVRGHRVHRHLADRVLRQLADRHAAAPVVDVVHVPVVRAHARHDRPQVRRPQLRDLDGRERAVADAPHRHRARRPRLDRGPLDRVVPVARLVLGVLVEGDAARRSGAADIHPAIGVAARRQPLPAAGVRVAAPVVLAVRDHLDDDREPLVGRVGRRDRAPQVGRQLHPVPCRDPDIPRHLGLESWRARGTVDGRIGHRPSLGGRRGAPGA